MGKGYTGGRNVDVAMLDKRYYEFGSSVSLNGAGDRLAVGAPGDDGADDETYNAGAVYLFTFTDTSFSGGRLAAVMGKGYRGGRNVDVAALGYEDGFGTSVSLNGAGGRLAVGAPGDDGGADRRVSSAGAVYLFTFTDASFSGGRLAATAGRGFTGGGDVDVGALGYEDGFGTSLSLNATGTRLAVGAPGDGGADRRVSSAGAVYLFTFTDTAFSGGQLAAVMGRGYTGGGDVDVAALESADGFGSSVSLNATGTRLAVGAPGDDGADNRTPDRGYASGDSGAVYLFAFTDTSFAGGRLAATMGYGYTGAHDINVLFPEEDD